jgi:hypothetical protein
MLEPWAEISERLRRIHPTFQTDVVPNGFPALETVSFNASRLTPG